ncbi:MAG TPA: protease complex subunit PrcB family protein, partial [Candidatus Paceibacterota bacterium]|nr:protease complex subunit PrcB family protein [Candidatus Paceibacterota bacterium]
ANTQPSAAEVPFTRLVQGSASRVAERINYRATSASQLQELWKMINATGTPPTVNFAAQEVIGVFAGQQPTPGYAIAVSNIEDAAARVVSITIARPEGACTTEHATTTPYELIAVPATALPLTHEDISTTTGCP